MGLADLHIHTTYSWDGTCIVEAVLKQAVCYAILDVVAITDHNTIAGAVKAVALAPLYGVQVIPGSEISTREGHVLAATSNARETFKWDDRPRFIQEAVRFADGRPLFIKLHPSERIERARREIERYAPQAKVYVDGNTNHMIANCEVLITQYSSVTFIGLALRKEVYIYLDLQELRRLSPIQNGGASARNIAEICKGQMERAAASTPLGFRRTLKQRSRYREAV